MYLGKVYNMADSQFVGVLQKEWKNNKVLRVGIKNLL